MGKKSDIISIENVTYEEVKSFLLMEYGLKIQENQTCQVLGMHIDLQDLGYAYDYARDFLEKEALEEDHPFYKEVDMRNFNIVVDICTQPWRPCNDFMPIIADQMGRHISFKFKTKVVIAFENGEIPFCMYDKGIKIKDLKEYYKDYLKGKAWQPTEIVGM